MHILTIIIHIRGQLTVTGMAITILIILREVAIHQAGILPPIMIIIGIPKILGPTITQDAPLTMVGNSLISSIGYSKVVK